MVPDFHQNIVKSGLLTAVRSTLVRYYMVDILEKSPEIEAIIVELLKKNIEGKHLGMDNEQSTMLSLRGWHASGNRDQAAKGAEKIPEGV